MAAHIKPIKSWKRVFLDTSFIIDYMSNYKNFDKNPQHQERILLAHKIMNILEAGSKENKSVIEFYISAITIVELRKMTAPDIARELIMILNSYNVVFIDFTKNIANTVNRSLEHYLADSTKHQFISRLEKEAARSGIMSARQWVSDDLKIIASANAIKDLDIILTCDTKTFKPIADKFELPCISISNYQFAEDLFGNIEVG